MSVSVQWLAWGALGSASLVAAVAALPAPPPLPPERRPVVAAAAPAEAAPALSPTCTAEVWPMVSPGCAGAAPARVVRQVSLDAAASRAVVATVRPVQRVAAVERDLTPIAPRRAVEKQRTAKRAATRQREARRHPVVRVSLAPAYAAPAPAQVAPYGFRSDR